MSLHTYTQLDIEYYIKINKVKTSIFQVKQIVEILAEERTDENKIVRDRDLQR